MRRRLLWKYGYGFSRFVATRPPRSSALTSLIRIQVCHAREIFFQTANWIPGINHRQPLMSRFPMGAASLILRSSFLAIRFHRRISETTGIKPRRRRIICTQLTICIAQGFRHLGASYYPVGVHHLTGHLHSHL